MLPRLSGSFTIRGLHNKAQNDLPGKTGPGAMLGSGHRRKGQIMPKRRHTAEEIIQHLRTAERERVKGANLEEATKKVDVAPTTLTRWKAEFGGLQVDQARHLKELERENSRFRKIVSDQSLDILILKEVSKGNF
jgi:hypothetical protein